MSFLKLWAPQIKLHPLRIVLGQQLKSLSALKPVHIEWKMIYISAYHIDWGQQYIYDLGGTIHQTEALDRKHHLHEVLFLSASYNTRQDKRKANLDVHSVQQHKQSRKWVTGQITGLKFQVLFYNKWPHSLLPQPLPNQAITVVTQGNCQKLRQLRDAAGSSDWGQFKRSACHFQGRVPVTFGKQFLVPWLPIKVLFEPVCFAQRYLKRTQCWAFRI